MQHRPPGLTPQMSHSGVIHKSIMHVPVFLRCGGALAAWTSSRSVKKLLLSCSPGGHSVTTSLYVRWNILRTCMKEKRSGINELVDTMGV